MVDTQYVIQGSGIMKKTRDIFISYKRVDGENYAKELYQVLIDAGYSVFLDTETLQSGKYEQVILERIQASTDFIVILTKSLEDDSAAQWVKKEIDAAVVGGCNIIPLYYTAPSALAKSIAYVNEYNGINAFECDESEILSKLIGTLLKSNQDIAYKEDPEKDEETNLHDYLHRHTTYAFVQIAREALAAGNVHDSNYSLAVLASQSGYDIISCMWVLVFKCRQFIEMVPKDSAPHIELVKVIMRMVEDVLANFAVLTDEGKIDSANRFFNKEHDLIEETIALIASDALDQ